MLDTPKRRLKEDIHFLVVGVPAVKNMGFFVFSFYRGSVIIDIR